MTIIAAHQNLPSVKRIAIFASGAGSNAKKIIEHFSVHPFIKVEIVVCNKLEAGVLKVADTFRIRVLMIDKEKFFTGNAYADELQIAQINFIVLAGFLWKIPQSLIDAYRGMIINIHPALLPRYGGKGMYGAKVHEAVIAAGEKISGITIHYVDEHYDNGDVILRVECPVYNGDTPESLAERIHILEHKYYPGVIENLLSKLDD